MRKKTTGKQLNLKNIFKKKTFSFLEKKITMRLISQTKFFYGPKTTPDSVNLLMGKRYNGSLVNVFLLIKELKKTIKNVYANSYHRGLLVISGIDLMQFGNIGSNTFYFFSPWHPGFLTNFTRLLRQSIIDIRGGQINKRHLPTNATTVKRVPQVPSYSVGLHMQHWQFNETQTLKIPQTITISDIISSKTYSPTCILPSKNTTVPAIALIMLLRESILAAKSDDKRYFRVTKFKKSRQRLK